jgi:hypothetical protein
MILRPQSPPIILRRILTATPKHTIVTTPDGRRMTLCEAIQRGESLHHDRFRSVR